jgi:glucose-6-phosphate isomerase
MVTEALKPYAKRNLAAHFISNINGTHLTETLRLCDPEHTLFIVTSKTFMTQETITNALSAPSSPITQRTWPTSPSTLCPLSTNVAAVTKFGIAQEHRFRFRFWDWDWDWAGARYSLWSAIDLSICYLSDTTTSNSSSRAPMA